LSHDNRGSVQHNVNSEGEGKYQLAHKWHVGVQAAIEFIATSLDFMHEA